MQWLQKYTFPTEAYFADTAKAKDVYPTVVRRLLEHGTTTAVYYATVHLEAIKLLVDAVEALGQRAVIGKARAAPCSCTLADEHVIEVNGTANEACNVAVVACQRAKAP